MTMHRPIEYHRSLILRFIILIFALLLTACQAGLGANAESPTPTPLPTPPALAKPTYQVQRGEVIETLRFHGRITPVVQESLFFHSSGRVNRIYFKEGENVEAGQVIADLVGIDELVRQERLNALGQRKAEIYLEMARLSLDLFVTQTPAWTRGYQELLAMKEREVELAEIAVEENSLYGQSLAENLNDSRIISPIAGKLISLGLLEGREVEGYVEVAIVAETDQLEVRSELDTAQMSKLVEGMEVVVKTLSGKEKIFSGSIRRMPYPYGAHGADEGSAEENVTRVSLNPAPELSSLKLGDLVSLEVIVQRHEDSLWLPPQAVRVFEGRHFVVVQDGNIQRRVDVKLGLQGDERVEILEGLNEGQVILRP